MTASRITAGLAVLAVVGGLITWSAPDRSDGHADPPPANPMGVPDPVADGVPLPDGYRDLPLTRDQILPVYAPAFTDAAGVDWPEDVLVIGVSGDETAKAYPVTHLNQREMVIDWIDGSPILVSW